MIPDETMLRHTTTLGACALVCLATAPAAAARAIAARAVPHGQIASEELEHEHGKLLFSFDTKVPGKKSVREVNVNAVTGRVSGMHEESPTTETKEARADSAPARADCAKHRTP